MVNGLLQVGLLHLLYRTPISVPVSSIMSDTAHNSITLPRSLCVLLCCCCSAGPAPLSKATLPGNNFLLSFVFWCPDSLLACQRFVLLASAAKKELLGSSFIEPMNVTQFVM